MSLSVEDFGEFHQAVHGRPPFDWQSRLLRQIVESQAWPAVLDLPTGSGKTTCIDIALFALALDAGAPVPWCSRRIAMVVDRRIVVDQVAERGRKLLHALTNSTTKQVIETARRLRSLSREAEEPLAVYTLRGGMPKDDTWVRTPDQPLILASTVDQLGSRLLIQGYGVSPGMRPVHAGLVANDLLLLLDEVHLSQPFKETLEQIAAVRARSKSAIGHRFHHAFLSATPGEVTQPPFRLLTSETARATALGPRLHASKPVRIDEVDDRAALELSCVRHAQQLLERHTTVAVVVNRVNSAGVIVRQLREGVRDRADVVLLTGRMRPLDRDDVLAGLRPRIITGRDRAPRDRPLVVIGTQCIEAGADFDFDALVTEAASLDALRQRFGRVDRLGIYERAEGVIVFDKSEKTDPVYGTSITATTKWLKNKLNKRSKEIDFGVLALLPPSPADVLEMLSPKRHAPPLLPAYLDLWIQTSPTPVVAPDPALWLHGPDSAPADVQVIWRADLTEDDLGQPERAMAIVAAIRPSSLEAMPLPFAVAVRWLQRTASADFSDVEGAAQKTPDEAGAGMSALRWDGDDSAVIAATDLHPGDTLIVPATRGGIRDGCFDSTATDTPADLAERAALFGRGIPTLRLHAAIVAQMKLAIPIDDIDDARNALRDLADTEAAPWRRVWYRALAKPGKPIVVSGASSWLVLKGRRIPASILRQATQPQDTIEPGIETTTDDESFHTGRPVTLADHSSNVELFARDFATAAGLPSETVKDLALAGWLHDIGKADQRFQVMLRGGSAIAHFKDPRMLAKSGMPVGAKEAQRLAQERSGYPSHARHEVQSLAMIEQNLATVADKAADLDLVLHLVATHHGYCRPFAPPNLDVKPVDVRLVHHRSVELGEISFEVTSSDHHLDRIDSSIADRFWRLVARYGWFELCWLEALLRLADHRASEAEQEVDNEA